MKNITAKAFTSAALAGLLLGTPRSGLMSREQEPSKDEKNTNSNANKKPDKPPKDKNIPLISKDKHACKGQNSCKGKGGCKSSDNGCKGKNSCKGKGGCVADGSKMPPS